LEGTRRWLPGGSRRDVEAEFRDLLAEVERATGATATTEVRFIRDAFLLNQGDPLVEAFQHAHAMESGKPLTVGPKPFVDDGNSFWALHQLPAITHGPRAGGQHTVHEWVEIDDLARVARLYARTAVRYCAVEEGGDG
jgi:acetylornithine deacetylase/succinyl-diaminopimelate desuccinylase-like protein